MWRPLANIRASKAETRERLLEAGRQLVVREGLRASIDVRLTDVLDEVGLTTGAAYNIWDSQDHYRRELALYIARNVQWADDRLILEGRSSLPLDLSLDEWVTAVADLYFEAFVSSWDYFILLHFWGVKEPDEELQEALRAGYDIVHQRFMVLFGATLERFGRVVKEPYTLDDLCTLMTAVCEGLALRQRFQPERMDTAGGHLFSAAIRDLTKVYTRPKDGG
jgi:AcrR family transcriptional regulator